MTLCQVPRLYDICQKLQNYEDSCRRGSHGLLHGNSTEGLSKPSVMDIHDLNLRAGINSFNAIQFNQMHTDD
jgi:hypothetical protein